jgi:hypothetical protein
VLFAENYVSAVIEGVLVMAGGADSVDLESLRAARASGTTVVKTGDGTHVDEGTTTSDCRHRD